MFGCWHVPVFCKKKEGKSVSNMWGMNAQRSWEFSFGVDRIPLRDHCNSTELNNNPAVEKKCLLLHLPYFDLFVKLYKALQFISMFYDLFQQSENKMLIIRMSNYGRHSYSI